MPLELVDYQLRVAAGVALVALLILALPARQRLARILLIAVGFAFMRDAMTVNGLWQVTGRLEMRFMPDFLALGSLTLTALVLSALVPRAVGRTLRGLAWFNGGRMTSVVVGLIGGLAVWSAVAAYHWIIPPAGRSLPPPLGFAAIAGVLLLSIGGNLLEEVIFRGLFQDELVADGVAPVRAALISAGLFAAFHLPLAFILLPSGGAILVFTLVEGLIFAFLRMRFGLAASVIAHATGIFLLASGVLGA